MDVSSNTNSKEANALRVLAESPSSSVHHRSQTLPMRVGRTKVDAQSSFKLASRSQTMPILSESAAMEVSPLRLGVETLSQTTTIPEDMAILKEPEIRPQHQTPLRPALQALSRQSTSLKAANTGTHSRRVLIVWAVCSFTFLILAPLISMVLGITLHTPDFSYSSRVDPSSNYPFFGRTVAINIALVSADPLQSIITFDWGISQEINSPCTNSTLHTEQCTDVNIFIDSWGTNVLRSTDVPSSTPLFRLNGKNEFTKDPRASSPIFRTDLLVFSRGGTRSSLINYPFDVYLTQIFMFAEDTNNQSVSLFIGNSQGNAVGFSTSAQDCDADFGIQPEMICIEVTIKRGALVRAFCIIVTIAIWLITLILLLLTFTSIIFGFRQRAEVLIVPVATIFAFTQLRTSMPGAPTGFGDILDFVGLLPCLGILAFSAALSLGSFILTDPTQKSEILTWGRLRRELLRYRKVPPANITEKDVEEDESVYSTGV